MVLWFPFTVSPRRRLRRQQATEHLGALRLLTPDKIAREPRAACEVNQ